MTKTKPKPKPKPQTAKHSTFTLHPFGFTVNVITTGGDKSAAINTILRKHHISERATIHPNAAGYFYHH